jgi:hypothetical protein
MSAIVQLSCDRLVPEGTCPRKHRSRASTVDEARSLAQAGANWHCAGHIDLCPDHADTIRPATDG